MPPYTVALVLDPNFGEQLGVIAQRVHTWIAGTPENLAAADRVSMSDDCSIENGVTTFDVSCGSSPEAWCSYILETVDEHHNEVSHSPGYSVLEVYGLKANDQLISEFRALGFTSFEKTVYGFRATKKEP